MLSLKNYENEMVRPQLKHITQIWLPFASWLMKSSCHELRMPDNHLPKKHLPLANEIVVVFTKKNVKDHGNAHTTLTPMSGSSRQVSMSLANLFMYSPFWKMVYTRLRTEVPEEKSLLQVSYLMAWGTVLFDKEN